MKTDHKNFQFVSRSIDGFDASSRISESRWHSDWQSSGLTGSAGGAGDVSIARKVRLIQRARINRSRLFDLDLFADPAWDILLDLFASSLEQRRVSTTGLCAASGVPATTALRWMTTLEERELIVRRQDPLDGRRVFVMLSAKGLSIMREYFQELALDIMPI